MSETGFEIGDKNFDFQARTAIMGILNVTPDSFSDGGLFNSHEAAIERALLMIEEGADMIDVGGESTRPGSERLELEEEIERVVPVIEALAKVSDVPISVDTYKSEVAKRALDVGAALVNDISSMSFDPKMAGVVANAGCPVVLMHTLDDPKVMQRNIHYENVVEEIYSYFERRLAFAESKGIARDKILIDPGIGFGKRLCDNIDLMRRLERFGDLGCPLLLGTSRKSFIGAILDLPVSDRLEGTLATLAVGIQKGASILRVHDIKESVRLREVCDILFDKRDVEERA